MSPPPAARALGERVAERRRRLFVGRSAEIELFRAALHAVDPPFSVPFLHGPGGIGKSGLLDRLAADAADASAVVVRADGGSLAAPSDCFADVVADVHRDRRGSALGSALLLINGLGLIVAALVPTDRLDTPADLTAPPTDGLVHVAAATTGLVGAVVAMFVWSWSSPATAPGDRW